ncbi:MAG: molybdenum cofactor guanylyltransferase [Thermodesulfobacteriota bacterium]
MASPSKNSNPPAQSLQEVTGVILAGGKSTRYGRNKAFVRIDGVPLIERVIRVMGSVFDQPLLITNTPEEYAHLNLPMVEDLIKGLGPLGGIYTGLKSISGKAGFFVACDMPFLNGPLIRRIVEMQGDTDAVVPRLGRMVEPLHALYAKTCIGAIEELIRSGNIQILQFFLKVRVTYVDEGILRTFDPELRCLANVNRPEDLPQGGTA